MWLALHDNPHTGWLHNNHHSVVRSLCCTQNEPVVLPARVPHLLVNGASGIAVGIATRVPPHNMREVVDGLAALIANPDITTEQLMEFIPGPDFPTGACGLWAGLCLSSLAGAVVPCATLLLRLCILTKNRSRNHLGVWNNKVCPGHGLLDAAPRAGNSTY